MKSPLVVGYKGEIGRFLLAGLLEDMPKANDILCVDVNNSDEDVLERIDRADVIFLCVPLQATLAWLIKFKSALVGKKLVEQSSIKAYLYQSDELRELNFLSMHLLFRPSATSISDRRAMLFSDRVPLAEVERLAQVFARSFQTPMEVLRPGAEPAYILHDKLMARHQALVHRVLATLADTLIADSSQTYVGQRVRELADRIRSGDPTLYRMIQENPYLEAELALYKGRLDKFTVDW